MAVESGVPFSLTGFVRHHFGSAMSALRNTPLWVWPLPLLFAGIVLLLLQTPLGIITSKNVQELAGPIVMGVTAALSILLHYKLRVFFTLLLACFTGALFMREWHFWGTTEAILVALAALAWWASSRREEIIPYLREYHVGGLLCAALWIYAISQIMDQHYLLTLHLVSLNEYLKWNDNIEETLETVGHMFVLVAVIVTYLKARPLPASRAST